MTRRWLLATSNSWRRFVDAETHVPVLEPVVNPVDGHPDLFMAEGVGPLVEAAPELLTACVEMVGLLNDLAPKYEDASVIHIIIADAEKIIARIERSTP